MPNDFDNFSLYVVVEGSGSLRFGSVQGAAGFVADDLGVWAGGGAFSVGFVYNIGEPPAVEAFRSRWTEGNAGDVTINPTQPQSGIAGQLRNGTVSGTLPNNTGSSIVKYILELTMVQPDE